MVDIEKRLAELSATKNRESIVYLLQTLDKPFDLETRKQLARVYGYEKEVENVDDHHYDMNVFLVTEVRRRISEGKL